jgi:hypothetical protein
MPAYPALDDRHFAAARDPFEILLQRAMSSDVMTLGHVAVEGLLEEEGREVLRLVFQGRPGLRGLLRASTGPWSGPECGEEPGQACSGHAHCHRRHRGSLPGYLINDRLGITGAPWGLEGAEVILRLRALRTSGDFHVYWRLHCHCERERNHLVNYEASEFTEFRRAAPRSNPFGCLCLKGYGLYG